MIRQAFSSFEDEHVAPVRKIDDRIYIQELFHGPTASFKDLALQLMPLIFDEAVANERRKGSVHLMKQKIKSLTIHAINNNHYFILKNQIIRESEILNVSCNIRGHWQCCTSRF